jgi:hypothetical protein
MYYKLVRKCSLFARKLKGRKVRSDVREKGSMIILSLFKLAYVENRDI